MMTMLAARATGASVLLIVEIQQQILQTQQPPRLQVQDNVVSALKLFWLKFYIIILLNIKLTYMFQSADETK